jgi:hypothetical protein
MKFYFDIILPKDISGKITIATPSKPFYATPGMKKKKIVTLRTFDHLADDTRKDTIIPITIHAYAIDANGSKSKKISVIRKSIFVYPKESILKAAK